MVAVTKGVAMPVVGAAAAAGLTRLGESRVQEALPKVEALPDAEWHLVGRLQANKARAALRAFAVIHSVDSLALLARLDRIAAEEGVRRRLLLQVKVSGEPQKAGFAPDRLASPASAGELREALATLRAVEVAGLMTIAPLVGAPAQARPHFRRLRELRDALQDATGHPLPELSMGMSGDAEAAVAEGATLVRIGTLLFWGMIERHEH